VKKYGNTAGLKIHPHTLRHSFAINLVRGGTDLRRVQLMLGHSSLSITQVYLQFNDNDLREAYENSVILSIFYAVICIKVRVETQKRLRDCSQFINNIFDALES